MPNPNGNFQTLKPYESKWRSGKTQTIRCAECGYHEHADIGAAKTIRDRALEMVRGTPQKWYAGLRETWYYVPKRPQDITTLKKQT